MKNVFDFDYNTSIVSVSNSILRHYGVAQKHASLQVLDKALENSPKNVIYMILDGLGAELLAKHLPENSFLRKHKICDIYSVFPPTTAAATIAYHSGLTPYESGWIGWMCYYPQYHKIIENFNNIDFYSGEKLQTPAPAKTLIQFQTIYEQIVAKNPDVEYHKIFPDFETNGCKTFDEMCGRISQTIEKNDNRKLISAYWTEPDHLTHLNGVSSQIVKNTIEDLNAKLEKMMRGLKDTILIVSADHGLTDVEQIFLNDYPLVFEMLKMPPCIEARFVTFFIKDGLEEAFKATFEKSFGVDFKLYTKEEFLKTGLLGQGKKHPCLDGFLGDFVAIAITNKTIRYKSESRMLNVDKADHAGISKAEMVVPLIVAKV
ncbi:MAG: alkaline phosphatase family protein [Alphaproteobacteria bacterium]|nr:alkaline phosphatase family protein [Alphaproteobacteria bacterium]